MCIRLIASSLIALVAVAPALGQTLSSMTFTYQGQLKEGGVPLDGTVDFEFTLWDAAGSGNPPTGGMQVGGVQAVSAYPVTHGLFTVALNGAGEFGADAFNGKDRWLQIAVNGITLSPRQPITATPYAIFAHNAANATQLEGQPAAFYQDASNIISGTFADARLSSNIALLNSSQTFTGAKSFSLAPSFAAAGSPFAVSSNTLVSNLNADRIDGLDSLAFLQTISGIPAGGDLSLTFPNPTVARIQTRPVSSTAPTNGQVLKWDGIAWAPAADAVLTLPFNGSANAPSVFQVSNTSINLNAFALHGIVSSTSPGGSSTAVRGQNSGTGGNGIGVWGSQDGSGWGVYGTTVGGFGVFGEATATTGVTNGVYGRSDSMQGRGVTGLAAAASGTTYGVYGQSISGFGQGVFGWASSLSGPAYGVSGQSDSNTGRGVFGEATSGFGLTSGVYGLSASISGSGVYGLGYAQGVYGLSAGPSGSGVYGEATSASLLSTSYGVYGRCNSLASYGVYSSGNMGASGTKPFRIDHPDDPANKYLLHYAAESPEVINFYSETVRLDDHGEATVELPHYFAKINRRPRYQLTAVGAPMPMLHVAEKISEEALMIGAKLEPEETAPICTFRIAGGAPGGEVSWEVKAIRNDRWVQNRTVSADIVPDGVVTLTHTMPVEVEKLGREKGTYQHPELYGQPVEKGLNYVAPMERDLQNLMKTEEPPLDTLPGAIPH